SVVWSSGRRSSPYERAAARAQCRAAIPAAGEGNGSQGKQFAGGCTVCPSSLECGIGGLGRGAKNRSLHSFLSACLGCLWLVCTKTRSQTLPRSSRAIRAGLGFQAHGHYFSLRAAGDRFLAATTSKGLDHCINY